jgi:hypothetical protein
VTVSGFEIPFTDFQLRGQLGNDLAVKPGAAVYAEADILGITYYGPLLILAGQSNANLRLIATGTYVTRAYDPRGQANKRPAGVFVAVVDYVPPTATQSGCVEAVIKVAPDAQFLLSEHLASILLADGQALKAVELDYRQHTACQADSQGNLTRVSVSIPAGTPMPEHLTAYVMLDAFPLFKGLLH